MSSESNSEATDVCTHHAVAQVHAHVGLGHVTDHNSY